MEEVCAVVEEGRNDGKEEWRKIGRVEEEMEGTNGRRSW